MTAALVDLGLGIARLALVACGTLGAAYGVCSGLGPAIAGGVLVVVSSIVLYLIVDDAAARRAPTARSQ